VIKVRKNIREKMEVGNQSLFNQKVMINLTVLFRELKNKYLKTGNEMYEIFIF
jgi:hypothetical protein